MKPPAPSGPAPKPWFYSRATVEILLAALTEAEAVEKADHESAGRYSVVAPRGRR